MYEFLWDQFADWYVEISKTRLYAGAGGGDEEEAKAARRVLVYVLDTCLRLLHPYMPYVTEKLWHHLPRSPAENSDSPHSLMLASWPQMEDSDPLVTSDDAVKQFECLQALVRKIRNARAEYRVEPGKRISAVVIADAGLLEILEKEARSIVALAKLDPDCVTFLEAGSDSSKHLEDDAVQLVVQDGIEAYLPLSGLIDPVKERKRLEKQNANLMTDISKLSGRLKSKGFVDKAPAAVVEKARAELADLEDQLAKVNSALDQLAGPKSPSESSVPQ